jgi:glucose-6-phosphate 1-epimerase
MKDYCVLQEMADFGDDEHPNMICVNAGHVASPLTLLPQQGFEASLILQVM